MKTTNWLRILFMLFAGLMLSGAVAAQDQRSTEMPPADLQHQPNSQPDGRGNLLRQLGLSREQIEQIRRIQGERGPEIRDAQRRFRQANRALDEAIYADDVNETEVQARLRDVQTAQAEVQRLRYLNELAVRRVLTSEQLVRFRELRDRFEQARKNAEPNRPFRNMRPMMRQRPDDAKTPANAIQPAPVVKHDQSKPDR